MLFSLNYFTGSLFSQQGYDLKQAMLRYSDMQEMLKA